MSRISPALGDRSKPYSLKLRSAISFAQSVIAFVRISGRCAASGWRSSTPVPGTTLPSSSRRMPCSQRGRPGAIPGGSTKAWAIDWSSNGRTPPVDGGNAGSIPVQCPSKFRMVAQVIAGQLRLARGKSGLRRAERLLTATRRKPMDRATETSPVERQG